MHNFGSVENYCKELQKKISRLTDLQQMSLPVEHKQRMEIFAQAFQECYFDLVDSDLYRK